MRILVGAAQGTHARRLVRRLAVLVPAAVAGRRFVNRVAVGSGTQEDTLADNVASAPVRVLRPPPPRVVG